MFAVQRKSRSVWLVAGNRESRHKFCTNYVIPPCSGFCFFSCVLASNQNCVGWLAALQDIARCAVCSACVQVAEFGDHQGEVSLVDNTVVPCQTVLGGTAEKGPPRKEWEAIHTGVCGCLREEVALSRILQQSTSSPQHTISAL